MDYEIIRQILNDKSVVAEKIDAVLRDSGLKKGQLSLIIAKELINLCREKCNDGNEEKISKLIAEFVAVNTSQGADDGDCHKATRSFLNENILNAEELLCISSNVACASEMGMFPGFDRIIRYLCGLKD